MAKSRKLSQILFFGIAAVMVLGLGSFGLNQSISSTNSDAVIKVGKSEISGQDYANALSNRMANFSSQTGQNLSMEEARLIGLVQDVRQTLVQQASLQEFARLGQIEPSDEAIAKEVQSLTAFHNSQGQFDKVTFDQFLASRGFSEAEFFALIRDDLTLRMALDALSLPAWKLPHSAQNIAEGLGRTRSINYARIDPTAIAVETPSDEEIAAYYDANPAEFMGEPPRKIAIAYSIPDESAVTAAEIAEKSSASNENSSVKSVTYHALSFSSIEEAQSAMVQDFAKLAEERGLSLDDIRFENLPETSLPPAMRADLQTGKTGIYGPYETGLGVNIFEVIAIDDGSKDAENDLRATLASEKNSAFLSEIFEELNNLAESQTPPQNLAQALGLNYQEIILGVNEIAGLTDDETWRGELDAASQGEIRPLVKLQNGGVAYFMVLEDQDPEAKPLEDVQSEIVQKLTAKKQMSAAQSLADEAVSDSNMSLESRAKEENWEFQTESNFTQADALEILPLSIGFEAFQTEIGTRKAVNDSEMLYLYEITEENPLDLKTETGQLVLEQAESQLGNLVTQHAVDEIVQALSEEFGATINLGLAQSIEEQVQ